MRIACARYNTHTTDQPLRSWWVTLPFSSYPPTPPQVGVIGGGAWGTALAAHVARMGHDTVLWAIESDVVDDINNAHENKRYLAGIPLPPSLKANTDLRAVVQHGELIVMVVPTPFVGRTLQPVADAFTPDKIMVSCTKGINTETLETVNQVDVVCCGGWVWCIVVGGCGVLWWIKACRQVHDDSVLCNLYVCVQHALGWWCSEYSHSQPCATMYTCLQPCTRVHNHVHVFTIMHPHTHPTLHTPTGSLQGASPCLSCTTRLPERPLLCQGGGYRPPTTHRSDRGIPQH